MKRPRRETNDNKKVEKQSKEEEHKPLVITAPTPNLPREIIEDILCRVPVKSLVQFRCVSKQWQTLLTSDSTFIQMHLNRTLQNNGSNNSFILHKYFMEEYYLISDGDFVNNAVKIDSSQIAKYGKLDIVGSSNGLICISDKYNSFVCLWNPATRDGKILPEPLIKSTERNLIWDNLNQWPNLGFCFDSSIIEYKVVRLVSTQLIDIEPNDTPSFGSEIEVYSRTTQSWRRVGALPYCILGTTSREIIKGLIHWVARNYDHNDFILSFNVSNELFQEIPMPSDVNKVPGLCLGKFRELLSMFAVENGNIDVWVMNEYGVKESWAKLYTVKCGETFSVYPSEFLKNGELLLKICGMSWPRFGWSLVSYNPECRKFKEILTSHNPEHRNFVEILTSGGVQLFSYMDVVPYVESLAQL